jgi:Flp pilus assembly pilin Flp
MVGIAGTQVPVFWKRAGMADRRRVIVRTFLADDTGGAPAIEFTLLAIPAIIIVMALVQTAILARATVVMESAAYAAARSALVHKCQPISPFAGGGDLFSSAGSLWGALRCNESDAQDQALRAARLAVIPISSSSRQSRARQGQCPHPDAAVAFIVGSGVRDSLREAVDEMACYAFEDGNVTVQVRWATLVPGLSITSALPPIEATVTFRMPVFMPVRGVFSDGRRGDGTHYREISATVTLL